MKYIILLALGFIAAGRLYIKYQDKKLDKEIDKWVEEDSKKITSLNKKGDF